MATNKHGLSRNIPTDVKREVRRHSKFGCVICRQLICDYEHIDPPFAEASAHEVDKICLLCPTHHSEVTTGLLSKDQVNEAYERVRTDYSIKPPFYEMQLTGQKLALGIGDSLFEYIPDQSSIINIDGEDLLHVKYERDPITGSVFPSPSARLYDQNGDKLLEIEDNEILFSKTVHDIKTHASIISVYTANSEYGVELIINPPSRVKLQRLHMLFKGIELLFDGNFAVRIPHQTGVVLEVGMPGLEAKGANAAVHYSSAPADLHTSSALFVGGVGATIPGTGLTFAKGAGSMNIKRIYVSQLKPVAA
jgi:hypothetical protein